MNYKMVEINFDKALKHKIDLMIKRVMDSDEQDNYLIIEGDAGSGKTNMSIGICHEVAKQTGRSFTVDNVFFDSDEAVNFAKTTKEQIIVFDEPVFGGLKAEWRTKTQINLIKLLYTSRVKRHFVVFNLIKFSKFSDEIIERAVALIRVFKKSATLKERKFLYIPAKKLPAMLEYYHKKHKRNYFKFAILRGSVFKYVLPEIIDKALYDEKKDKAIESIGIDKNKKVKLTDEEKKKMLLETDYNKALIHIATKVNFPITIKSPYEMATKLLLASPMKYTRVKQVAKQHGLIKTDYDDEKVIKELEKEIPNF